MTTESKKERDNMFVYVQVDKVPQEALKSISAGRLRGMSDINPMWRIKAMTQAFGPCGIGWRYTIDKQWTEQYGNEVKCFCNVSLYIKVDGSWSEPIQGTGGSAMVAMERSGAYVNDEAYKMALTDALSVAMKSLGVGANIYFSKDSDYGTKYSMQTTPPQTTAQQQNKQQQSAPQPNTQSLLLAAKGEAAKITDRNGFGAWWNKYPTLQQNQEFLAIAQELGKKFPKK